METKKVLGIIFSLLFLGAFAFVLTWGIINFNKVKDGMSGTQIYDSEDINKAYQDGYDTALKDKEEYTELINGYRDTITTLNDNISQLNSQISLLTLTNKDYSGQIDNLTSQKNNLEFQVENLTNVKTNNEKVIQELKNEIEIKKNLIANLESSEESKISEINQLNTQVLGLQNLVAQLQTTNELNAATISSLNLQVSNLNKQISDMTLQSQNVNSQIANLTAKVNELQASVNYYESYIAQLETGEQVVITFEYDGSVYNIQIVNKGSKLSIKNPESTNYKVFNGWKANGELIDMDTFVANYNTRIIADITYKYDVIFRVDGNEYNKQLVVRNGNITMPLNPAKEGYEFDGWSTDGVSVIKDLSKNTITANTIYEAVFTKIHTVKFMYENSTFTIQSVRNGESAENVVVENTKYKIFNGWKINNTVVDIENYRISKDTIFVADITYYYDAKFIVDEEIYENQIIIENGIAKLPASPTKNGFKFIGWSIDGTNIVNVLEYKITQETVFVAKFAKVYNVKFYVDNNLFTTSIVNENETLPTIQIPYKAGYAFNGWLYNGSIIDISNLKINSDMELNASFTKKTLEQCSWSEISDISKSGKASSYFKVGDTKNIQLSTGEVITVAIMGFNHDDLSSGGKAGITFGMTELLATKYTMHSSNSNTMSWKGTDMRNNVLVMFKSFMPTDLQNSIRQVNKRTSAGNKSTSIVISSDTLWLFSETEIYGSGKLGSGDEGAQYTYYQTIRNGKNADGQIKRLGNGAGDKAWYFLRSPRTNVATAFCSFGAAGGLYGNTPTTAGGVCFGFCI